MKKLLRLMLVGLAAFLAAAEESAQPMVRATAKAMELPTFDFNHPPREYTCRWVTGWKVMVEQQLITEDAPTATRALARLQSKLTEVALALPPATLVELQQVKIYLLYGSKAKGGGRDSSFQYFAVNAPRYSPHLDDRMANSVVIFSAYNYNFLSDLWALKSLVHELAHAYHLLHWREREPAIYDAWAAAMQAKLYRSEVAAEAKNISKFRYAAQNHLEYFAELSAMYFAGCNYPPTNRAELKSYDPIGYDMVERYWGVTQAAPADSR